MQYIIHHCLNCGPNLTIITTAPSKVAYLHCTRIRQGQAGVSAITRRPNAFIVAHELGWASTRSRLGPPFCPIRNIVIIKSLQWGIQSYARGCNNSALIADMKLNLKRTLSTRISSRPRRWWMRVTSTNEVVWVLYNTFSIIWYYTTQSAKIPIIQTHNLGAERDHINNRGLELPTTCDSDSTWILCCWVPYQNLIC